MNFRSLSSHFSHMYSWRLWTRLWDRCAWRCRAIARSQPSSRTTTSEWTVRLYSTRFWLGSLASPPCLLLILDRWAYEWRTDLGCFEGFCSHAEVVRMLDYFCVYHVNAPGHIEGDAPLQYYWYYVLELITNRMSYPYSYVNVIV